jgi:hypothetical protein
MLVEFAFTYFWVALGYFRARAVDAYLAPPAYTNILVLSIYDLDLYPLEDSFEFERKNL